MLILDWTMTVVLILCVLLAPSVLLAQGPPQGPAGPGGPPVPEELTVRVDCDAGESLQVALEQRAERLTVLFTGVCAEDVVIARDDVTLRGQPSAIISGDPAAPAAAGLTVFGGSRIVLEDFTVSDEDSRGIHVKDGAAVDLMRIVARENPSSGMTVVDSFVRVEDSRFNDNGFIGIGLWGASSIRLQGVVEVSRNVAGLSLSGGSGAQLESGPHRLEAVDNTFIGVNLQFSSGAQLDTVIVTGSPIGISLFQACSFAAEVDVRENLIGIFLTDGSSISPSGSISDNGLWGIQCRANSTLDFVQDFSSPPSMVVARNGDGGIQMLEGCTGQLGTCRPLQSGDPGPCGSQGGRFTVMDNGRVGLEVDDSTVTLENAAISGNGTDLQLAFGSRATFGAGNDLGVVACDGTVFTRGGTACPAEVRTDLSVTLARSSRVLAELPADLDLLKGGVAPFRLEP